MKIRRKNTITEITQERGDIVIFSQMKAAGKPILLFVTLTEREVDDLANLLHAWQEKTDTGA